MYKAQYIQLQNSFEAYSKRYPNTAKRDLDIIKRLSDGFPVKRIASDMFYDQSTIYYSIERVENFLKSDPQDDIDLKESFVIPTIHVR